MLQQVFQPFVLHVILQTPDGPLQLTITANFRLHSDMLLLPAMPATQMEITLLYPPIAIPAIKLIIPTLPILPIPFWPSLPFVHNATRPILAGSLQLTLSTTASSSLSIQGDTTEHGQPALIVTITLPHMPLLPVSRVIPTTKRIWIMRTRAGQDIHIQAQPA